MTREQKISVVLKYEQERYSKALKEHDSNGVIREEFKYQYGEDENPDNERSLEGMVEWLMSYWTDQLNDDDVLLEDKYSDVTKGA